MNIDTPHFNCSLNISGSEVSWNHCITASDYISYYIINITDTLHVHINITTTNTSLTLHHCNVSYHVSVHPVNIVGEGEGVEYDYFSACPTSGMNGLPLCICSNVFFFLLNAYQSNSLLSIIRLHIN